jgi:hypothetical protein
MNLISLLGLSAMSMYAGDTPTTPTIPGYSHGQPELVGAPYSLDDLAAIKRSMLFSEEDERLLRQSGPILEPQIEQILDVWYGFVAATPELLHYFSKRGSGDPDGAYLDAVRKRFAQWIRDTAAARHDQAWLDYQYEIGLRHSKLKKNRTDGADSATLIHFRYLIALNVPITTTLKPFLAKADLPAETVDAMHAAWVKAVLLQTILWSHPYVLEGEF